MKRYLTMILTICVLILGSKAHAEWDRLVNLAQKIPSQNFKSCKFRVTWPITAAYNDEIQFMTIDQTGFIESRSSTTGKLISSPQVIFFDFSESTFEYLWATNSLGQSTREALRSLKMKDATAEVIGLKLYLSLNSPNPPEAFLEYRNEISSVGYPEVMRFQLLNPKSFILERECVAPGPTPSPAKY